MANIDQNSHHKFLKSMKSQYKQKRSQKESYVINGIKSLAQENLFILKRLITQESEYSAGKLIKKYKQSRKYKNIICRYPSINFNKTKKDSRPLIQTYELSPRKNKLPKINEFGKRNFLTLQTKYLKNNLDSHYFKEAKKSRKNNTMNGTRRTNNKKNSMKIVTENEDESSNSNKKKSEEEGRSGSNEGSQNDDDEGGGSSSGSGSGSGSGDEKE